MKSLSATPSSATPTPACVYVDEAAPADPSVGYEGSDRIDFSCARIIAQRWDDTEGEFRDVKSDFNPSMIY